MRVSRLLNSVNQKLTAIPYSWSQLKDIMRRVGEVTYVDAHNRMGRGRGECCFATREIMMKAKDELDGFEINGKRIQLYIKVSFIIHSVLCDLQL